MLKVFAEQYENLKEFIKIDKELQISVSSVNEEIVKEILPILEMFDTSTLILSQNSSPTIQLVFQIKRKILLKLESDQNDSKYIKKFKTILKANVQNYMKIHDIHKFALVFDPKRKDLKYLSENDKKVVIEILKENMKSLSSQTQTVAKPLLSKEPEKKKKKMTLSEEFLYESEEEIEESEDVDNFEQEIDSYLKAVILSSNKSDLLKFWFEYSTVYPNIANVAKKILALPATQFESERNFSLSGRTLESRRTRLLPENVDYLLFIKSNYKL
jgi:hypothetical protein